MHAKSRSVIPELAGAHDWGHMGTEDGEKGERPERAGAEFPATRRASTGKCDTGEGEMTVTVEELDAGDLNPASSTAAGRRWRAGRRLESGLNCRLGPVEAILWRASVDDSRGSGSTLYIVCW